jgi:4-hydroxybenzoate polyprenyltransferase
MGGSAALVVHHATATPLDDNGLALLLCGILAAYSVDRFQDAADIAGRNGLLAALRIGAAIGVAGAATMLVLLPLHTAMLVPVLGAVVLAYSRLKAFPLLKSVLVPVAWTWSLIALPFQDGSWFGWQAWRVPIAIPLMCLIASGCLLCDLKDVDGDRNASVSSLPVLIGVHGALAIAVVLSVVGAAVAAAEHRIGLSVGGIGLGLAALYPEFLTRDVFGPLLVDVILTIPGLLIALHIV